MRGTTSRKRPRRPALRAAALALGTWAALSDGAASSAAAASAASPAAHSARAPEPARHRHAQAAPAQHFTRAQRAAFGAFASDLAAREGLPAHWVLAQLDKARHVAAVRRLVMPPPTGQPKNWQAYRERFVEPQRVGAGLAFWRDNEAWLQRAEAEYGVPPQIVVAIIGVETFYGRIVGNYRVLDALSTLAFDFPPDRKDRSGFFRSELEAFLLWCHRESLDPIEPRGSYAGAIGLPQFMPSSLLRYGVAFDGGTHVDLRRSAADAIGSVANYLAQFGWQRGMATTFDVEPPADDSARAALLAPDIVPSFSAAEMTERGARLSPAGLAHEGRLALVTLNNGGSAPSYFAGSANFYVITRYNWSSYYAMAVVALAEALVAAR